MKKRHGVFFGFAVLLITAIFTLAGCDNGSGGGTTEEEFKEEDAIVNDRVIASSENKAGLNFFVLPDIELFKDEIATAKANGFVYITNTTGWPKTAGSSSAFVTGKQNQLSAQGSGFTFTLETNVGTTVEFRPGIGFGSMFTFTSINLTNYTALRTLVRGLTPVEDNWVMPTSEALADLGIGVFTMYNDQPQNITNRIDYSLMDLGENTGVMIYYGGVMVDRTITDFNNEGVFLPVSDGKVHVWSDGTLDGKIIVEWWIAKQ